MVNRQELFTVADCQNDDAIHVQSINDPVVSEDNFSDVGAFQLRDNPSAARKPLQSFHFGKNGYGPFFGGFGTVTSDVPNDLFHPFNSQRRPDDRH